MLYNRTKTLFISELKIYTPLLISPNFLYPAIGTHQSNLCFYEFDLFFLDSTYDTMQNIFFSL